MPKRMTAPVHTRVITLSITSEPPCNPLAQSTISSAVKSTTANPLSCPRRERLLMKFRNSFRRDGSSIRGVSLGAGLSASPRGTSSEKSSLRVTP